jgi:hypothetical protein
MLKGSCGWYVRVLLALSMTGDAAAISIRWLGSDWLATSVK